MAADKEYNLDKTIFQAMTVEETDVHYRFWKKKSMEERMQAACFLINQMYGITAQTPLQKKIFNRRKHKNA